MLVKGCAHDLDHAAIAKWTRVLAPALHFPPLSLTGSLGRAPRVGYAPNREHGQIYHLSDGVPGPNAFENRVVEKSGRNSVPDQVQLEAGLCLG